MTSMSLKNLDGLDSFLEAYSQLGLEEDYDKMALRKPEINVAKCKEVLEQFLKFEWNFKLAVFKLDLGPFDNNENSELNKRIENCFNVLRLNIALNNTASRDVLLKILHSKNSEEFQKVISEIEKDVKSAHDSYYYFGTGGPIEGSIIQALIMHMTNKFKPLPLTILWPQEFLGNNVKLPEAPPEAPNAPFPKYA